MRQRLDDADDKLPLAWQHIVRHLGNCPVSLEKVNRCSNLETAIGMKLTWAI